MNLYELFKKFETEFLAGHFQVMYIALTLFIKLGGNHIEVTAVGYGYSFEVEYHITKHKLLKLAVINTLFGDCRITYAVEYD